MKTRIPRASESGSFPFARAAIFAAFSAIAFSAGCASRGAAARYPVAHVGVAHKLDQGTIVSAREVVIDGEATGLGRVSGAAVGGAAGAVSAGGSVAQRTVGVAIGGVVGSIVGNEVEKRVTEKRAQELTIRLDSGELIVVVRPVDEGAYMETERVQVFTTTSGATRVLRDGVDPTFDPDVEAYDIDVGPEPTVDPVDWFARADGAPLAF